MLNEDYKESKKLNPLELCLVSNLAEVTIDLLRSFFLSWHLLFTHDHILLSLLPYAPQVSNLSKSIWWEMQLNNVDKS